MILLQNEQESLYFRGSNAGPAACWYTQAGTVLMKMQRGIYNGQIRSSSSD